jgi:hypothetical protein
MSFKEMIIHQIFVISITFLSMYGVSTMVNLIINNKILVFIFSGIVYLLFLSIIVYIFPFIISSDRKEIKEKFVYFIKFINLNYLYYVK